MMGYELSVKLIDDESHATPEEGHEVLVQASNVHSGCGKFEGVLYRVVEFGAGDASLELAPASDRPVSAIVAVAKEERRQSRGVSGERDLGIRLD